MVGLVLPAAVLAGFPIRVPISVVIIGLLLLVTSYRRTTRAYPNAGGADIVCRVAIWPHREDRSRS
jgi:hypothetical protein